MRKAGKHEVQNDKIGLVLEDPFKSLVDHVHGVAVLFHQTLV